MSVFPKDYKPEEVKPMNKENQKSLFTRFNLGDNKVRILSEVTIGYVWWENKKPYRCERLDQIPSGIEKGGRDGFKEFWAFKVYNHTEQTVQVMEVTQTTIKTALFSYNNDEDWGDVREYDLNIRKTGEGMKTEYTVIPSPKKELTPAVLEATERVKINWENYMSGEKCFEFPEGKKEQKDINPKDLPF